MKHVVTTLLVLAFLNLSFATYATGGEVEKRPLNLEEMVVLTQEQREDYEETRKTEAGLANGYGILSLAVAAAVTYFVYDEVQDQR